MHQIFFAKTHIIVIFELEGYVIFLAFSESLTLTRAGQINELASIVRDVFAALFPVAQSPFVATALVEILTDIAEKSVEAGVEGMS